ncbi:MAG TPA: TIGR03790 family protein [Chthoniobacterales bacterium]
MTRLLCALVGLSLGTSALAFPSGADLAGATIVVYNRNAVDSIALAHFYASARHISDDHLVGLECSTEEEISRQEYDETIAEPLRKRFSAEKWWTLRMDAEDHPTVTANRIHFVALIRGMPLKIRATVDYPGDRRENNQIGSENKASVDSELSVLGLFSREISGAANNPYFQSFRPIGELEETPLLLVGRLDAPTTAIVRRMITDAVETEKKGLWGRAYVDGSDHTSGGLADGDQWLKTVTKDLRQAGIPVVYDTDSALFPPGFPMSNCALYYGWYASGVTGPFTDPDFHFEPGAVAVHIHSFSASTLRSTDANWVGPLLSKGAAASLGNVYEPYLQLTTHLDIFNDRLLHGFTFAESASMGTRVLSWMNVAVGDPLYRPYANWLQLDAPGEKRKKSDWRMYHEFAVANAELEGADYLTKARAAASRAGNGAMIEDLGLMEKESGHFESAISYLRQARSLYSQTDDLLRAAIEQVDASFRSGDKPAALNLIHSIGGLVPDGPRAALLKKIETKINPPPPTPQPSA